MKTQRYGSNLRIDIRVNLSALGRCPDEIKTKRMTIAEMERIKSMLWAEIETRRAAYNDACLMIESYPDLEIRSALKQAAADHGIAEGDDMAAFVYWAEDRMGV